MCLKLRSRMRDLKLKSMLKLAAQFDNRYYDSPISECSEYCNHDQIIFRNMLCFINQTNFKFVEQPNLTDVKKPKINNKDNKYSYN